MYGASIARNEGEGLILLPNLPKWRLVKLFARLIWVFVMMPRRLRRFKDKAPLTEKARQEFILNCFKPLTLEAGRIMSLIVPDPATDKYHRSRNTARWIKLRDEYFEHERLEIHRTVPFMAIWNLLILLGEYNQCYDQRMSWIRNKWGSMEWDTVKPQRFWKE